MKKLWLNCEPLPAADVGARLCRTFNYTWNAILKVNETLEPWQTITDYPLKPRVLWRFWQDAGYLVGVRFDDTTQYALIDIDWLSQYHPQQSADGIRQIRTALESIGICRTFCTRSSDSKGIHLWIPLEASVPTFWLATALKACLETHGLTVKQGELETFPNCKAYAKPGEFSDYQGHRLPLQPASGAALLNTDLEAVPGGLTEFFRQWDWAAAGQDLPLLIEAIALAKTLRRHRRYRSGSAVVAEWRRDLETEITEGWTGRGQTNHLLKTIACYGVVFQALSGERLTQYVLDTVERLPGYFEWCRHQHEIKARAQDWAKMAEGYYWALGTQGTRTTTYLPSNEIKPYNGNEKRAAAARERIQAAFATLSSSDLPNGITARADALIAIARCSNQTLHKHKDLWHPDYLNSQSANSVITVASQGSVCMTDQTGDWGEMRRLAEKVPNRSKPDQMGLVHTLPQQMKGSTGIETLAPKTHKTLAGGLILPRTENRQTQEGVNRVRLGLPKPQPVVRPAPAKQPETTTAPNALPPVESLARQDVKPVAPVPPTPGRTLPIVGERGRESSLSGLESLLSRLPVTGQVRPGNGVKPPPLQPLGDCPLPSDPLPVPETPVAETPTETPKPKPRPIRPVKSKLDPTSLPPGATYIAPPLATPAIAPKHLWDATDAVQALLRRLQTECQWTAATVQEWIAAHFDGRRRSELADHELPLLLERLQAYWQQQGGGEETQEGS